MNPIAGIKRKPQARQTESRKRRATETSYGDTMEVEDESEQDPNHSGTEDDGDEDPELSEDSEDSLGDIDELSDQEDGDEDDEDVDDEDGNGEFEEFKWFKPINISIKADDAADSPRIGFCNAGLVDRDNIRADFHRDMEALSHDAATLGFSVFNRWGCLKPEFLAHPVKKGTEIWGSELNKKRFLLIERFQIQETYQRKGYGKKLFEEVWKKAQNLAIQEDKDRSVARKKDFKKIWEGDRLEGDGVEKLTEIDEDFLNRMDKVFDSDQEVPSICNFAIVWAAVPNTSDVIGESDKLSSPEVELFYQRKQNALEDFWRAMGFRCIGSSSFLCLAKDPHHASHSLLSQDDYIRPAALRASARADNQDFPLMDLVYDPNDREQKKYNDAETKELLEARFQSCPATDPTLVSTDRHENNILHLLARTAKVESLVWALRLPFANVLRSARNLEGETPLEALRCQLESDRTWRQVAMSQVVMSDLFPGFTSSQIECLKLLENLKPSPEELTRLRFGCSCRECLGGFLSPRNTLALLYQADFNHDMLNDDLDADMSGSEWCEWREDMLKHLIPSVRNNLRTNKSLRQGFTTLLGHIAKTLQAKKLPLTDAVLHYAANEWPPDVKNFLQRGGTVFAVVQACFDYAIDQDIYLGDGTDNETSQENIDALPACRNDGEFVFARRMCRKLEGLPDELNPSVGMRGIWD